MNTVQQTVDLYDFYIKILAIAIIATPFFAKIETRSKKWYKRPSRAAWIILVLTVLSYRVTTKKSELEQLISNKRASDSEKAANRKIAKNNKANEIFIKQQQDRAIIQIAKSRDSVVFVLAKSYNLIIDTTKRVVLRSRQQSDKLVEKMMQDSTLRQAKYYSSTRSSLELDNVLLIKKSKDSITVQLKLQCTGATAYNVNIYTRVGYDDNNIPRQIGTANTTAADGDQIGADRIRTIEMTLPNLSNIYFFYLKGTYVDNLDLSRQIPFERLIFYNLDKKVIYRPQYLYLQYLKRYIKYWD
ncbi:MAG: hypothetical protein WC615_22475 [Mucilaginibacter sp.]|jgi:hypothetical protein|uniref:hypothetical protein n=1 Tax=Mucilaginibacter sp. TaxID=1882438 RepID=UPI00356A5903